MENRFFSKNTALAFLAFLVVCVWGASTSGHAKDPILADYFNGQTYHSRGEYFNVSEWAAASRICDDRPDTVACMACSFNLPRFALEERLAPIGVYDELWKNPEPAAVCGMCLKIWLPEGRDGPECTRDKYETYPHCPGRGNAPYTETSPKPYAWSSPVLFDEETQLPYIRAIIVEWYDLYVPLPYGISYALQGVSPKGMGSWPVQYTAVPCPVDGHNLEYSIMDQGSDAGNLYNKKIMISGQRTPISGVEVKLQDGVWYKAERTGDGFWKTPQGIPHAMQNPIDLKIWCADSHDSVVEPNLVPANILCTYQDPDCVRQIGTVQC